MTVLELSFASVLGCWLSITALSHLPQLERLRERDPLGLIPAWNFFAPQPGKGDYRLLVRYRDIGGRLSEWTEVDLGRARRWYAALWNPAKRENKFLVDVANSISRHWSVMQHEPSAIALSIPYLYVLGFISHMQTRRVSSSVQFMIMYAETPGLGVQPEPFFVSGFHEV